MSQALYRRYRPQKFSEILGQNYIKTILQNQVSSSMVAHAYLFCGPRAVGKTTMARVLAKTVNCLERKDGDFEPCNNCTSCLAITAGSNLGVVEIDAASNTGVDNVRENIISSSRVSVGKGFKVFIIDEVHMLSTQAFNALLKTLEEPSSKNIFILCTTEMHKVPATIISRCQRFDFRRLSQDDVVTKLQIIMDKEGIEVEKEVLQDIALQTEGYLRDAESLLGQVLAIADNKKISRREAELVIPKSDLSEVLELVQTVARREASGALKIVNDLASDGFNLKKFNEDLLELLRKMFLSKISPSLGESMAKDFGEVYEKKMSEIITKVDELRFKEMLERFSQSLLELKNSFIAQLPLELAIVDLCSSETKTPPPVAPVIRSSVKSVPQAPPVVQSNSLLSKAKIEEKWDEFVVKVKANNHSIAFLLQSGKIKEISDGKAVMAFKYKFHKDRWDSALIQEELKKVAITVYGKSFENLSIFDESLAKVNELPVKKNNEESGFLDQLLQTFGGEMVA